MDYAATLQQHLLDMVADEPMLPFVERLVTRPALPPLVPTEPWDVDLAVTVMGMSAEALFRPGTVRRPEFAACVKSGLLLWNDAMDASHTVSQEIHNETGSYWHAIMHRREPDYSNALYWFHKVEAHTLFAGVREAALELAAERQQAPEVLRLMAAIESVAAWDPRRCVQWCEAAAAPTADPAVRDWLQALQLCEMQLLLAWSIRKAR